MAKRRTAAYYRRRQAQEQAQAQAEAEAIEAKKYDEQKAAIYIRVSTQYQVDRASLPVQREELINYARYALSIEKYDVFEDAGYSGKNMDRPAYQHMMSRVRLGEFSHILVWKIDRISRNLLDFAGMYAELKKLGVTFVSKNEQFDTSSAMGEAMLKIILVFAELERNMTSERVTAVMISRAQDGQWNGGKIPFGYSYDKATKTISINETEAKVVRLIFDTYEKEGSLVRAAHYLNERGIRQRSGHPWTPSGLQRLITNPFYVGTMRYNYRHVSARPGSVKPEGEWVIYEDHHDAIIDPKRQEHIIQLLGEKRRNSGNGFYQRKNVHVFAGLLKCSYCGSLMSATIDRPRADGWQPSHYICTRHRRFDDCPNKFISDVTLGPFVFNYIANMIRATNSFGKTTSIETLEKKLLRGPVFSNVSHIGQAGLKELYDHLRTDLGTVEYTPLPPREDANSEERDLLLAEKRRLERALNRLKSLYLYSEDTMSEVDYIVERKNLTDSLEDVVDRLEKLEASLSDAGSMSDEEFIAEASYFVMAQNLLATRYINYENFIRQIDPSIPKNFIRSIVQNFCIRDGKVVSILFKNGIEHQFFYKDE